MDFAPTRPWHEATAAVTAALDATLKTKRDNDKPRTYLGGSRWGHHCERALGYEYFGTPKDEGRGFEAKTYRIFDMGHDSEERMAEYLRLAGFDLRTHREDGSQFGFKTAYREDGTPRLAGNIDGAILSGPDVPGLTYPALWENKALNASGWQGCVNQGIERNKPVYFAQAQVYMAYMQLDSCLFTAVNRNTGEVFAEVIAFDPAKAQALSDKAVRVVSANSPEELVRAGRGPDDFGCKWCDYKDRCWAAKAPAVPAAATPTWLKRA